MKRCVPFFPKLSSTVLSLWLSLNLSVLSLSNVRQFSSSLSLSFTLSLSFSFISFPLFLESTPSPRDSLLLATFWCVLLRRRLQLPEGRERNLRINCTIGRSFLHPSSPSQPPACILYSKVPTLTPKFD